MYRRLLRRLRLEPQSRNYETPYIQTTTTVQFIKLRYKDLGGEVIEVPYTQSVDSSSLNEAARYRNDA
ncbi:MAG: hypothetical protein LBL45_08550 [Treponema sp.]|nr:hypothetical protein [Treponema sp.]